MDSIYYDRLTANNCAMLMIDHQTGTMLGVQDIKLSEFRSNVLALAKTAKMHNLPTVLTASYAEGPNGPLMAELTEMFADAPTIYRPGPISAWDDPNFVQAVQATGRNKLVMSEPIRILLQTTIPPTEDDWGIHRFSLLQTHLSSLTDDTGNPLVELTARDRSANENGDDRILSQIDTSDFDELWLLAVDIGDGLTDRDCEAIDRFRQQGKGIFAARDHQDLGSSLCKLSGGCHAIGASHFFHSLNPDPDSERHCNDDRDTTTISWPNYHSGKNGDYQRIIPTLPPHELLLSPLSPSGLVEFFPAHPHEGSVGVPSGETDAVAIAMGRSLVTQRTFNLAVAFDRTIDRQGNTLGRAVTASTFHHFCDYNWNPALGCPSFVTEAPGDGILREPQALSDTHTYIANIVRWLAPQPRS